MIMKVMTNTKTESETILNEDKPKPAKVIPARTFIIKEINILPCSSK